MRARLKVRINIKRYIESITPLILKKPVLHAWLFALIKPIDSLNTLFELFVINTYKEIRITGQTIVLEHVLNEKLTEFNGGIKIESIGFKGIRRYIYARSEGQQAPYLYYRRNIYNMFTTVRRRNTEGYDFVVFIPVVAGLSNDLKSTLITRLKGIVNKYKLSTKSYIIKEY